MEKQLLIGLLLSFLPVFELRAGLPVVIEYLFRNNQPILPYFLIVLILNIGVTFFIFFFLDFLHKHFMKIRIYRRLIARYLKKVELKSKKIQKKIDSYGYLALSFFVGIPLPGTGVWTGTLIAWILKLDRKKSILAISFGVIIAGIIILLMSLGIFNVLY